MKLSRRKSIKIAFGMVGVAAAKNVFANTSITPSQTAGPFYPIKPQLDTDLDLTHINGSEHTAKGQVIEVYGIVYDQFNNPIVNAVVDIWQANAAGRYSHEDDSSTEPLDPNFQGWGIIKTNSKGQYRFKTIKPGQYLADKDWVRPAHIHFKISKRGYRELTTQMYFKGDKYLTSDALINELSDTEQQRLIVNFNTDATTGLKTGKFDIVLAKVNTA